MVISPPGSPPSRRGSNQQQGGQLLQELEALSQALYQAQRRGWPAQQSPQAQAVQQAQVPSPSPPPTQAPKKHSFLSRRETLPARRFSSHDPKIEVAPRNEPAPHPGVASRDSPTSFGNLLSRNSVSSPNNKSRGRFSASTIPSQPSPSPAWNEEKSDIRPRVDRRLSLPVSQIKSSDSYIPEEPEWSEDLSRKADASPADKKKSIWNWKPLRALSHIGRQRYHCVFSAYAHAIEGLPSAMNGLRLCVHMKKEETKEGAVQTMPSRVFQGIAEFQETLFIKCTLYSNKGQSNALKFMAKAFIVSVICPDVEELDFGRHQLDLSRLLADSLDERKGEPLKGSSWDTTLDLTGKAKGGKLVVTFSYELLDKESESSGNSSSRFKASSPHRSSVRTTSYSLPNSAHGTPRAMTARAQMNHSPSISEPANDYEDLLAMEHLNLDEPSPFVGANEVQSQQAIDVQGFPAFRSQVDRPSAPSHNAFNAFPNFEAKTKSFQVDPGSTSPTRKQAAETLDTGIDMKPTDPVSEEDDASSEVEAEFVVVDKGMEIDESAEKFQNGAEGAEKTPDNVEKDDLDDLTPHVIEEYSEKHGELETDAEAEVELIKEAEVKPMKEADGELMKETELEPMEDTEVELTKETEVEPMTETEMKLIEETPVGGGEIDVENSVEVLEDKLVNIQDEHSEVLEDKLVNIQDDHSLNSHETEKKETVTYQMVMRTLESLLEGTSAKEQPQDENLEERSELEESSELEETLGEGVPGEEDASPPEVMKKSYTHGMEQESDSRGTDIFSDTQSMMAEFPEQKGVPQNIDNEVDLVAGEFLHLLESGNNPLGRFSDSEPDSPRARLLKQFEQEALLEGGFGPDLSVPEVPELLLDDISVGASVNARTFDSTPKRAGAVSSLDKTSNWDSEDEKDLTSIMEAAESELQRATQSMRSRTRAKMLEDAETEALMQEWGLNEKAFVSSPPKHTFKQQEPPPLGKGMGSAVPLKDGGTLRSMNPLHFQTNTSSGKLVMQVSKPVVVPAEMGSGTVDILRNMASMGVENMAVQAMTAMPLEDVTGMSVEHIAMEGMAAAKSFRNRHALTGSSGGIPLARATSWNDKKFDAPSNDNNEDFVSLEDLAPMAMQQIEALAVDGLKIQADMSEDDAPYALNAFSVENQAGVEDVSRRASIGTLKGVTGVHLLKGAKVPAETSGGGSGLMDMAITLDEWMLLDAGMYDEAETKKDTLAIMAAHHAVHQQLVAHGGDKEESTRGGRQRSSKGSGWGCMGNTLTIAMLVQLRDPLRNNEAVGAPMMAFVQAERMFKPPKPKVGRTVSMKGNSEDEEADSQPESQPETQFKITGIHMAGLKAPPDQKKIGWGSQKQQQTGSRWLIANGMSKNAKSHPLLKANNPVTQSSGRVKVKPGESLWSISARVHGTGSKWKDLMKLNPHIRNPDVIYENQSLRTK